MPTRGGSRGSIARTDPVRVSCRRTSRTGGRLRVAPGTYAPRQASGGRRSVQPTSDSSWAASESSVSSLSGRPISCTPSGRPLSLTFGAGTEQDGWPVWFQIPV